MRSVFSYNLATQGGKEGSVIGASVGSMVFGFLIELFTTVVFEQARPDGEGCCSGGALIQREPNSA